MTRVVLPDQTYTDKLGRWLATRVKGGQTISLEGPLGAGKTTLLQGLAAGLGASARTTSPTFIMFRVLPVKPSRPRGSSGPGRRSKITQLVHADAYRIQDPDELAATGFTEYLGQPDTLTVVEWGDRVRKLLPSDTLTIKLERPMRPTQDKRVAYLPAAFGKPHHEI